jgi:hypothetical protein
MCQFQLEMGARTRGTRGLAAEQAACKLHQVPLFYFHAVYVTVCAYLARSTLGAGRAFGLELSTPCRDLARRTRPPRLARARIRRQRSRPVLL